MNIPLIPNPKLPLESDYNAKKEEELFRTNNLKRAEKLNHSIHWMMKIILWIASILLIATGIVKIWHLIGLPNWLWIDEHKMQEIDKILVFFLGTYVAKYFDSILKPLH